MNLSWIRSRTTAAQRLSHRLLFILGAPLALMATAVALAVESRPDLAPTILVGGLTVSALLGTALAFHFARRLLLPLKAIVKASDALKSGQLSARALVHCDDEIGRLARSFNAMADRLERRERAATRLHELSHLLQTATDAGEALAIFERLTPVLLPGVSRAIYAISPSRDDLELKIRFGPEVHDYRHRRPRPPTVGAAPGAPLPGRGRRAQARLRAPRRTARPARRLCLPAAGHPGRDHRPAASLLLRRDAPGDIARPARRRARHHRHRRQPGARQSRSARAAQIPVGPRRTHRPLQPADSWRSRCRARSSAAGGEICR